MTSGPELGSRVVLRTATEDDEGFLLRLLEATRFGGLETSGLDGPQRRALVEQQRRGQQHEYLARFPAAEQSIVLLDGSPVGQIWIARSDEELRLLDISLLPEQRGRRIGTILLSRLVGEADETAKPIRLTVSAENTGALELYRRVGFSVVGRDGLDVAMERLPGTPPLRG